MNINKLIEKSVDIIKSKCKLPDNGFLSGGSLANVVYGLLYDIETNFDDVDVFVLKKIVNDRDSLSVNNFFIQTHIKRDLVVPDSGYAPYITEIGDYFFSIESSEEDGILNIVNYYSNTNSPFFVDGFDLNCTQVSYDLSTKKPYYTKEFEHFLRNKEIKVSNLKTASNTAIRYLKKCKDLKIKPVKDNLDMIYTYISKSYSTFHDSRYIYFREKTYNKYKPNKEILDRYFLVEETTLKNNKGTKYRFILRKDSPVDKVKFDKIVNNKEFNYRTLSCWNFPKLWESISESEYKTKLFEKLGEFAKLDGYIDTDKATDFEINLISGLCRSSDIITYNLMSLKLSEQIKLVNLLFNKFKNEKIVAYTILSQNKFNSYEFTNDQLKILKFKTIKERQTFSIKQTFEYFLNLIKNDNKK